MHIEINAGGLSTGLGVSEFQLNMAGFISDAESVISCFKTVQNEALSLSGGVGNLQSAVDEISERIRQEEDKLDSAVAVQNKANDFLELAVRVDKQVASQVNRNKDQFYQKYPHLEPVSSTDEENWGEKAWAWICGAGEYLGEKLEEGWNWVKDTAKKAWDGLVEFYNEHKKIIDTVLIVVGAIAAIAAVVASGGAALVPLLGALGLSTSAAIAVSSVVAVVAVVSTVGASTLNIIDTWAEIDDPTFNTWQKGLNITSAVSNFAYSVGTIYNSIKHINPTEYIASKRTYTDVGQLSGNQVDAINNYSGDNYRNINDSLRGLDTPTPENAKTIRTMKSTLDNASLADDMTLYRGTNVSELGDLQNLAPDELIGKTYIQDGFMSTTSNNKVATAFQGNMHVTIDVPKGAHALDISSISNHPYEGEFLFSSGQELLITGAEKINGILHIEVTLP